MDIQDRHKCAQQKRSTATVRLTVDVCATALFLPPNISCSKPLKPNFKKACVCKPSPHALQATGKPQQGTPKRPLCDHGSSRCPSRTGGKYTPSQKTESKYQPLTLALIHTTQKQLCESPPSSLQRNRGPNPNPAHSHSLTHSVPLTQQ